MASGKTGRIKKVVLGVLIGVFACLVVLLVSLHYIHRAGQHPEFYYLNSPVPTYEDYFAN